MVEYDPATVGIEGHNSPAWPLVICLLGTFRVLKGGQAVAIRPGSKIEALLAFLGLRVGQFVTRENLVQALWPNSDEALANHSLRSVLYNSQQLLGDAIRGAPLVIRTAGSYRLNVEAGVGVDVAQFDALVSLGHQLRKQKQLDAAAVAYNQAIHLYRGDLHVGDADLHAVMVREHLRAHYLSLLRQLAYYQFELQEYAASAELARRLLDTDPCSEDAHRLVMRCYVRLGERSVALHQYRVCIDILRTEFNMEPEPATRDLFEQIRRDPSRV